MKVTIIRQDHYGRGIAQLDGKIVFIPKCLKGDIVDIEIIENKKKYMIGKVNKYISTSIKDSVCEYYDFCGGCHLLHQEYNDQLKFKEDKVKDIINKFTNESVKINPICYSNQFNYRNKIVLHDLGLNKEKSNDIIKIKSCKLVNEKINELIIRLHNLNVKIDEVMIRITNQNELMLDVNANIDKDILIKNFTDVDVIILNNIVLTSKSYIIDIIDNIKFQISNKSFYQVNSYLTKDLYGKVIEFIKDKDIDNALDLYCGTGTITLLLSKYVNKVTGIEIISEAIDDANKNKIINNISNVDFICGKVEDYIDKFNNLDLIVVDPPRAGLDNKTIDTLLGIKSKYIVYVSCDPITLARDLNVLKNEYNIKEVNPFDMFPNTYHVESVCLLSKKNDENPLFIRVSDN